MANNKKQAKSKAKPVTKSKSTDKKACENCIKKNKSLTAKLRAAAKREKALKQELKKLKTKATGKKKNKSSKKNKKSASSKTKKSSVKKSSAKKSSPKKKVTAKKTSTKAKSSNPASKAKPISTIESTKMPPARPQPKTAIAAVAPKPRTSGTDNLKRIAGIGPAIERHLKSAGIDTFEKLGNETPGKIKAILLEKGGTRYNVHDPAHWPRQAKLAAAGKIDQLKALQAKLNTGK